MTANGRKVGVAAACVAAIGAVALPGAASGAGDATARPAERSIATQSAGTLRPPPSIGRHAARDLAVRTLNRRFFSWRHRGLTYINCRTRISYRAMRCYAGWVFRHSVFFGRVTVWYTAQDDDYVYFRTLYTIRRFNKPCVVKFGFSRRCRRDVMRGGL